MYPHIHFFITPIIVCIVSSFAMTSDRNLSLIYKCFYPKHNALYILHVCEKYLNVYLYFRISVKGIFMYSVIKIKFTLVK